MGGVDALRRWSHPPRRFFPSPASFFRPRLLPSLSFPSSPRLGHAPSELPTPCRLFVRSGLPGARSLGRPGSGCLFTPTACFLFLAPHATLEALVHFARLALLRRPLSPSLVPLLPRREAPATPCARRVGDARPSPPFPPSPSSSRPASPFAPWPPTSSAPRLSPSRVATNAPFASRRLATPRVAPLRSALHFSEPTSPLPVLFI